MNDTAKIYYIVFGVITLVGGIIGFIKAKSPPSLVAGIVCAAGFFVAAYLVHSSLTVSLIIGLLVSITLAGKFVPDFIHKKALFPGGIMALLSVASIVITVLALNRK